jgi:hypothetical protein
MNDRKNAVDGRAFLLLIVEHALRTIIALRAQSWRPLIENEQCAIV